MTKPKLAWQGTAEMIRRVNTVKGREMTGLYSVEGTRLVERALRAAARVDTVLMGETYFADPDPRLATLRQQITDCAARIVVAPDERLRELTAGRDLGAIIGLVQLPQPPALNELVSHSTNARAVFLAGIDILDPGNAGALVRTAHAGGAVGFLAVGRTDPFHPRATRISRGSIFRLPVISYSTTADLLAALRTIGVRTVATAAQGGTPLPSSLRTKQPTAILLGNEGEGLPTSVLRMVDEVITIPMPPDVDSYAVNAAAAIVLYELQRPVWSADRQATESNR